LYKVIHITDIHIVPEGQVVVGMDPNKRFSQVIDSVNQKHGNADLCVISGDLTDRGDFASYELVSKHLAKLNVPYRLMLGNHDNRTEFRRAFPHVHLDDHGFVQSWADLGDIRLIFLDTKDDAHAGTGILCSERIDWLSSQLEEATHQRIILFMHHPPKSLGVVWFDNMMLENPMEFWDLLARHPNVEHIAFGHLHLTTTGRWGSVSFSCNRGTCHRISLGFDADAVEYVDGEPTYDVLLLNEDSVIVHHTAPVDERGLIAREFATPDGVGRIEYLER
jgi:3',5'-cyclic AMP phosphodiesterase CpdA